MQRTVIVCDECGRSVCGRPYFSLTVSLNSGLSRRKTDCCSPGCLLRRLSKELPVIDSAVVEHILVNGAERGSAVAEDSSAEALALVG